MNALLTDLAARLGERWATKLALPGAMFLASMFAAAVLGHAHAVDADRLVESVGGFAEYLDSLDTGAAVVVSAGLVGTAIGVGYVARAIGTLLQTHWLLGLESSRVGRWLPVTRLARLRKDLRERYIVDLSTVWPALWMHLTESDRQEIATARAAVRDGATLIGWALLSFLVAAFWWPMLPVAAALLLEGRRRSWSAVHDFALTIEAVVKVHASELAVRLGLAERPPLTRSLGYRLTLHLQDNRAFELTERHRDAA